MGVIASRFIPACAGNTINCRRCTADLPVYPRWRGEHFVDHALEHRLRGLSPLARGTLADKEQRLLLLRFIPAGAGNTITLSVRRILVTVYPRWRGEHIGSSIDIHTGIGLSPLARGTPQYRHLRLGFSRFIPAGAGNTPVRRPDRSSAPVYPRWRGEHDPGLRSINGCSGLSPLARGTHAGRGVLAEYARFIPAGSGNTVLVQMPSRMKSVYPR